MTNAFDSLASQAETLKIDATAHLQETFMDDFPDQPCQLCTDPETGKAFLKIYVLSTEETAKLSQDEKFHKYSDSAEIEIVPALSSDEVIQLKEDFQKDCSGITCGLGLKNRLAIRVTAENGENSRTALLLNKLFQTKYAPHSCIQVIGEVRALGRGGGPVGGAVQDRVRGLGI